MSEQATDKKQAIDEAARIDETIKLETIKRMNVYQRVCAVTSEVGKVAMTLDVDTGRNSSYKALSINDVVDSLLPVLTKYRLVAINGNKEIIDQKQIVTTTKYGEKNNFFVRMKSEVVVVNIDNPEERVKAVGYGDGIDTGDKACGKADTYARKYALISLFNLSKGEDPDVEASAEYKAAPQATITAEQFALEYTDVRSKLTAKGVDVHGENFEGYVKEKAKVSSLDPGALMMDLPAAERVLAVVKAVLERK